MAKDTSQLAAVELSHLMNADTGEIRPLKYRVGSPRAYRFDAGKGQVNRDGQEIITKSGEPFSFIPVAWRVFNDNLFDMGRKKWAEMFFVNQHGILCLIMFHTYTVESLIEIESDLFYDDLKITDVVLTIKPEAKTSKKLDEATQKPMAYYIGKWTFEAAKPDVLEAMKAMTAGQEIYRLDTFKNTAVPGPSFNYALDGEYECQKQLPQPTEAEKLGLEVETAAEK